MLTVLDWTCMPLSRALGFLPHFFCFVRPYKLERCNPDLVSWCFTALFFVQPGLHGGGRSSGRASEEPANQ